MGRPQQSYYDHLLLGKTKSVIFEVLQRLNAQRGIPFAQELAARVPDSSASSRRKAEYSFEQFTEDLDGSNNLVQRIVETLIKETALQAHVTQSTAARAVRSIRSPSPTAARRFSVYNPTSSPRSRRSRRTPAAGADGGEMGELSGSDNEDGASATSSSSATPEPTTGSVARALELEHLQNQSSTARQLAAQAQLNASSALRTATSAIASRRPIARQDITTLQRAQRRAEEAQAQAESGELDVAYHGIFDMADSITRSRRAAMSNNTNNDLATSAAVSEAMQSLDRGLMARLDAMRASHSRLSYLQSASDARTLAARRDTNFRGTTVDTSSNSNTSGEGSSATATYLGRGRSIFLPHGSARPARLAIPMPIASALDSAETEAGVISDRAQQFRVRTSQQRAASRATAVVSEPRPSSSSTPASTSTAAVAPLAGAQAADGNIIPARGDGEAYTPSVHDQRLRRGLPLPAAAEWQRLRVRLEAAMCDAAATLRRELRISVDEVGRLLSEATVLREAEGPQSASYVGELSCLVEPVLAQELDLTLDNIPTQPTLMQSNARRWMAQASWAWSHALRICEALPVPSVDAPPLYAPAPAHQQPSGVATLTKISWLALQDYYAWAIAHETRTVEGEVGVERVVSALAYLCDRFGYDADVEELNNRAVLEAEAASSASALHRQPDQVGAPSLASHASLVGVANLPSPPTAHAHAPAEQQRRLAPLPPRARDALLASTIASTSAAQHRPAALTPWANTSGNGNSSSSSSSGSAALQERERRVDQRLTNSASRAVVEADETLR